MNSKAHKHRPMFLFGSYTSPLPKVSEITKAVLTGDYHFNFSSCKLNDGASDSESDAIKGFLQYIQEVAAAKNYEDIAFVVNSLWKQIGTQRDPTIEPFYREVISAIKSDPQLQLPPEFEEPHPPSEMIERARLWIAWVVFHQLKNSKKTLPEHLISFFKALDTNNHSAWICTLNHDCETERALKELSINYSDGFTECVNSPALFQPALLSNSTARTTLIKLHGSIDWFASDRQHYRMPMPFSLMDISGTPVLLSGSLNKLEDYTYQLYPWLWAEFQNQLLRTKRIICSGYGFMDLGVTSRLSGWLNSIEDAMLLIIDPDPAGLIRRCRAHSISNIKGFFGYDDSNPQYTICEHSSEIQSTENSIILLKCGFENVSDHGTELQKFAYEAPKSHT